MQTFFVLAFYKPGWDGFNWHIIEPLSTALSSALNKSQQHQKKIFWEGRQSNLGLLIETQCYAAPSHDEWWLYIAQ